MHSPSIADLILPSKKLMLAYALLLLAVLIGNTQFVQQQFAQLQIANEVALPFIRDIYQDTSSAINQDMTLSKLSIGLVWGAIGAVVYILFWLASNIIREMRNIVVEELYFVKPNVDSLWRGRLLLVVQVLYRVGLIMLIACFIMALLSIVFPFVMQTVRTALGEPFQLFSILSALASLGVLLVSLHSVIILTRLLTVRDTLSRHVVAE